MKKLFIMLLLAIGISTHVNAQNFYASAVPEENTILIRRGAILMVGRSLLIKVNPLHVPANRQVTIKVNVYDADNPSVAVSGKVFVNNGFIGETNKEIKCVFTAIRKRVRTVIDGKVYWDWEVVYPTGFVRADGYPDSPINFGFPNIQ